MRRTWLDGDVLLAFASSWARFYHSQPSAEVIAEAEGCSPVRVTLESGSSDIELVPIGR